MTLKMGLSSIRVWVLLAVLGVAGLGARALAQASAALINVHGHVNNALGQPITQGQVKFSTEVGGGPERKYGFSFPIDGNGDWKGQVPAATYIAIVWLDNKSVDYQNLTLKAGPDVVVNFDMTREEYLKAMSPEDRKVLEETKAKNAGANAYNAKVADLNKTMLQARADSKAGKTGDAVAEMQNAVKAKPDETLVWVTLGDMQLADANASVKAARLAKTSPSDPALIQKYTDTVTSYQKGIELANASPKKMPEVLGSTYMNEGEALAKSGKFKEANDAYDAAVKTLPSLAGQAYYNEAATLYNAGKLDEAASAADKAIAADPKRADSYYIKGASLVPKSAVDPKTQKIVAPPGCIEAYQEYLELDPDGAHSKDVKELLVGFGQPIKNSYKAGRK